MSFAHLENTPEVGTARLLSLPPEVVESIYYRLDFPDRFALNIVSLRPGQARTEYLRRRVNHFTTYTTVQYLFCTILRCGCRDISILPIVRTPHPPAHHLPRAQPGGTLCPPSSSLPLVRSLGRNSQTLAHSPSLRRMSSYGKERGGGRTSSRFRRLLLVFSAKPWCMRCRKVSCSCATSLLGVLWVEYVLESNVQRGQSADS
jgi:hypothetical protein